MVQAPNKQKLPARRIRANIPLIAGLFLFLSMVVLLSWFFRFGATADPEAKPLTAQVQQEIHAHVFKFELARKQKNYPLAIEEAQKALQVMEREKSDDGLAMTSRVLDISDMLRDSGEVDKASAILAKANNLVEKFNLEENKITCEILMREGIFSFLKKNFADAEDQFQQALSCSQALSDSYSVETSQCLIWLANIYLSKGFNNPKRSLQCLRIVEEICGSSTPERPAQLLLCQKVQGLAYMQMKKFSEAEERFLSSKEIADRILPAGNPESEHLKNLLSTLRMEKKPEH